MTAPVEGREVEGLCSPTSAFDNPEMIRLRTEVFYPDPKDLDYDTKVSEAKAVCRDCPARTECLDAGLHEQYGIWGGTSEEDRKALRKRLRNNS